MKADLTQLPGFIVLVSSIFFLMPIKAALTHTAGGNAPSFPMFVAGTLVCVFVRPSAAGVLSCSLSDIVPYLTALHVLTFVPNSLARVTFIAGITMFRNMDRVAFGQLQSKLFPKYFYFNLFLGVVALVMTYRSSAEPNSRQASARQLQLLLLGTNVVCWILNAAVIGPISSATMFKACFLDIYIYYSHFRRVFVS